MRKTLLSGRVLLSALSLLLLAPCLWGQTPSAEKGADASSAALPFDVVASIKPNKSGSGNVSIRISDSTFVASNVSVKMLLSNAYGIRDGLISGLSGPVESAHFDINAKILVQDPEIIKNMTREQRRGMLLQILRERFQLKAHKETKILPVYELVVMKDGPKFKASAPVPAEADAADNKNAPGRGRGSMMSSDREMTASYVPLSSLSGSLSQMLDRSVLDKTGLSGNYDFSLKWTPEEGAMSGDDGTGDKPPSIFTALQEQLGLKLQPAKGPVETLVVDHVEMPSED